MEREHKTALFYGGRDIRVVEEPIPEPGLGEVLVRVREFVARTCTTIGAIAHRG